MQYRKFNVYENGVEVGKDISLLGFGCMRLPMSEGAEVTEQAIDKVKAAEMLKEALAGGINYIDTAYPYHSGNSEPVLVELLKPYHRDSYYLATILPCWLVNSLDDAKKLFDEQLKRLQTDHLDFYLLHSLDGATFDKMKELGVVDWIEELKQRRRIRFFGFSFHGEYADFEHIATYKPKTQPRFDFCQIQLNYMDVDTQAGEKGYVLAEKLGLPLVIMEPIKGGSLASLPDDVKEILAASGGEHTPPEWALRWVASHPSVNVILSGMSSLEQMQANLATFGDDYKPLNEAEQTAIASGRDCLQKRVSNNCTGCAYCMPCPAGVNIPTTFMLWNEYGVYQHRDSVVWKWSDTIIHEAEKPKNCVDCGKCEELWPQSMPIRADLRKAQAEIDALL